MENLIEILNQVELKLLTAQLGGQSSVAELLNVNRSSVSRWTKKGLPDENNQIKITSLVLILQRLHKVFDPKTSQKWLKGINAHLAHQKPIDLIKQGRISEVLSAIEQTDLGAFA